MTYDPVPNRVLARTGRSIARVIWKVAGAEPIGAGPGEWTYVPAGAGTPAGLGGAVAAGSLVVGVTAGELLERRGAALVERLAGLGVSRCEAVMLEAASPGEIKAGGPFHRLSRFREKGLVQSFFIDAPDYATAEWMLNHTPAHAVCVPFGLGDLSAKFRLLEEARNFGTAVVARPVEVRAWEARFDVATDLSFVAGEEDVASMLLPAALAPAARRALDATMPREQRSAWWERYRSEVAPPPMPTRNLPPEFGA